MHSSLLWLRPEGSLTQTGELKEFSAADEVFIAIQDPQPHREWQAKFADPAVTPAGTMAAL